MNERKMVLAYFIHFILIIFSVTGKVKQFRGCSSECELGSIILHLVGNLILEHTMITAGSSNDPKIPSSSVAVLWLKGLGRHTRKVS
jgi:hypothetical protein